MDKFCKSCLIFKDTSEFEKGRCICKCCRSIYLKHYKQKLSEEKKKEYNRKSAEWARRNKSKTKEYARKHREKYIDKYLQYSKNYTKANRQILSQKEKERAYTDIEFKLRKKLRSRLYMSLKSKGVNKHKSTFQLLGCTIAQLKQYLESKFLPTMTWENHGNLWHIDHIIPCKSFNLKEKEQQEKCFHYTNLQPLFKVTTIIDGKEYIGNLNKNAKIYE